MKTTAFEHNTCSRCGGSGKMPFSVYAGICFKCHGAGYVLTKRGRAASQKFTELMSKRADELVAGDKVRIDGFSAGSFSVPTKWYEVESVEFGVPAKYEVNGVRPTVDVVKCKGYEETAMPGKLFRVAQTGEQKAAKLAEALAYQASLTKQGVPSKRKAA